MNEQLSEQERQAIDILKAAGWIVANNPHIEDCGDLKIEGRYQLALCKKKESAE